MPRQAYLQTTVTLRSRSLVLNHISKWWDKMVTFSLDLLLFFSHRPCAWVQFVLSHRSSGFHTLGYTRAARKNLPKYEYRVLPSNNSAVLAWSQIFAHYSDFRSYLSKVWAVWFLYIWTACGRGMNPICSQKSSVEFLPEMWNNETIEYDESNSSCASGTCESFSLIEWLQVWANSSELNPFSQQVRERKENVSVQPVAFGDHKIHRCKLLYLLVFKSAPKVAVLNFHHNIFSILSRWHLD